MGEAKKCSVVWRFLLITCMGVLLTACASLKAQPPEEYALNASAPISLSGDMGLADIDREISLATERPEALVGEHSMGVSELSEDVERRGDPLELSEFSLELLPGDKSGAEDIIALPRPGSREERHLASLHTNQNLCSGSETLCITSPYGARRSSRRSHKGIDIRAPLGSPIMAFRGGVVLKAEFHRSYGFMVEIQQDDGLMARYAHMSQILVNKGVHVQPGFMIGRVGSTGRSTGAHLHFELLRDNRQMNPMVVLPSTSQVVTKATPADVAEARKAMASRKGNISKKSSQKNTKKRTGKTSSTKVSSQGSKRLSPSGQGIKQKSSKRTSSAKTAVNTTKKPVAKKKTGALAKPKTPARANAAAKKKTS